MPKSKDESFLNPLIQESLQDTLLHVSAVMYCLKHIDLKSGLEDEGELGFNLILDTMRGALRYEAMKL